MLTKLNVFILGCFFLFVTPLLVRAASSDSELITGPQVARITVPRAIVYSDESMNSPLGYISNDKLITVGNPRKKNPELVPLVVYGRLAFIELKNIHYESESMERQNAKRGAPKEHNIDDILIKPEERLSENNSAYFHISEFFAGEQTKNLFETIDGESKDNLLGLGVSLIHRQLIGRAFWGAGFEYSSISSEHLSLNTFIISPIIGYTPLKNSLFLLDFFVSMDFSGNAQLKLTNNFVTEPAPFFYGPQISSRIVLFPTQKYHIVGTLGFKSYKVLRIEQLTNANDAPIDGITKVSGLNFSLGFAFEI